MKATATLRLGDLAAAIRRRSAGRPRVLVGVDGPGASGKSTLAELLAAEMPGATVVHVDDFYLPSALQGSRDGQIAPHFDWPRLVDQVIEPAATGDHVRYQRYDWDTDSLDEWHDVPSGVPLIVEGVYSLEPAVRAFYTFTVFCQADPAMRLRRGLERDGEQARDQWVNDWMPAEDTYAARDRPSDSADLVVDSSIGVAGETVFHIVRAAPGSSI
jgi:uridine kinase